MGQPKVLPRRVELSLRQFRREERGLCLDPTDRNAAKSRATVVRRQSRFETEQVPARACTNETDGLPDDGTQRQGVHLQRTVSQDICDERDPRALQQNQQNVRAMQEHLPRGHLGELLARGGVLLPRR